MATPPWTSLRELGNASLQLEQEELPTDQETLKWLNMLIAPGSSLRGARPKASVQDKSGDLWIAKFPSKYDGVSYLELAEFILRNGANVQKDLEEIDMKNVFFESIFLLKLKQKTPVATIIYEGFSFAQTGFSGWITLF